MSDKPGHPVWIEFWPRDWPHGHMLLIADGSLPPDETWKAIREDMEGYAEELANAILACNPERHGGRGHVHSREDAMAAFKEGMRQLMERDYAKEWADQEFKERMFAKWGGHMPAAVLSFHPDDPKAETLMVPDKDGNPVWYTLPKRRRILSDIMGRPREGKNAIKDPTGLGWLTKPWWRRRS